MKGKNSFRFNGLVHEKTVGINLSADKKGIVLSTKKQSGKLIQTKQDNACFKLLNLILKKSYFFLFNKLLKHETNQAKMSIKSHSKMLQVHEEYWEK